MTCFRITAKPKKNLITRCKQVFLIFYWIERNLSFAVLANSSLKFNKKLLQVTATLQLVFRKHLVRKRALKIILCILAF